MNRSVWSLLKRLRTPEDPSSDEVILGRFVNTRDEAAFELLVWRHGGFVLSVCRRMLRDAHAAEDAFQATFLILARKAGSVRGSLAGWLHQVARRVCLRAISRGPVPATAGGEWIAPEINDPIHSAELRNVLDEEIARLPERLRLTVVHCYLQNRPTEEAANKLGIPRGTVLSRLSHARQLLTARLTKRGIAAPATFLTASLTLPTLSADVCRGVAKVAIEYTGATLAPSVSTQLAHEVLVMAKRKTTVGLAACLLLTAGVGTGVGVVTAQGGGKVPDKSSIQAAEEKPLPLSRDSTPLQRADQKEKIEARRDRLLKSEQDVMDHLRTQEAILIRVVSQGGAEVDPSALKEKLEKLDTELLDLEAQVERFPVQLQSREKQVENAKAGRHGEGDKSQMASQVSQRVYRTKEVVDARTRYEKRLADVRDLQTKSKPEGELVKEAERLLKAAEVDLQKARDLVQPQEEKAAQERAIREWERILTRDRDLFESTKNQLKATRQKRVEWVMRIQRANAALEAQKLIDDEIQVLRDIRKQVLKERLMLEMGLDGAAK